METREIKLVALDLDGTLTQHKSKLAPENRAVLAALAMRYRLVMVGAGACARIHQQMDEFPLDIIGYYGMQFAAYNHKTGALEIQRNHIAPVDREEVEARVARLRRRFGYEQFAGDSTEYHASGMLTFPLLGTGAALADKLAFDPTREKRKPLYPVVKETFFDYTTFIGGSSSFDLVPFPFCKRYALDLYCQAHGLAHENVVYVGDDYGEGGNDEDVDRSDFSFIPTDDYTRFPHLVRRLLDKQEGSLLLEYRRKGANPTRLGAATPALPGRGQRQPGGGLDQGHRRL